MFKVNVDVMKVYGSKGPGYCARYETLSTYHPSRDIALALLHQAVCEQVQDLGFDPNQVYVISKY